MKWLWTSLLLLSGCAMVGNSPEEKKHREYLPKDEATMILNTEYLVCCPGASYRVYLKPTEVVPDGDNFRLKFICASGEVFWLWYRG